MSRRFCILAVGVVSALALTAAGCDDDDDGGSTESKQVDVGVTETGKAVEIAFPAEVDGGATELTLDNSANKQPHSAQVIRLDDGHTFEEAGEIIGSEEPTEIPEWLRGYGGVPETEPGETRTATLNLDEGHYAVFDDASEGEPPVAEFDVSGDAGDLPDTDATVTAATTGDEDPEYEWQVDGLEAGENTVTFVSEGDEALHHIVALPIKGDTPFEEVEAEFKSDLQGPPQTVEEEGGDDTAVIDGEKSEITTLTLEPGRYVFACFLSDRDEPDESHVEEGLLTEVTIEG
jgi:hypothetical protein